MLSKTCLLLLLLLLLLAGFVASELALSSSAPCVSIVEVLDHGFLLDDTICPGVSDESLNILEEAAADSAEGKLLLAMAHYSRMEDQAFFQRVEEALSSQSLAPAHTMLAVHLMAFSHQYLIDSGDSAREWYQLCLDLDENHKQCLIEASRLLTYEGGEDSTAWFLARKALSLYLLADVSPFELPCSVVIQGARSALNECWNGLEGVCTVPKIFLALNLIDIAETVCDKDSTLQHIFEAETIVSVLKNSMANLYGDESPPDLRGNCISAPPTTDDEIVETNLLAFFHHSSHRCDSPEEVSFGEDITIGNETTGDVDLDAAAVGSPVVQEPSRLRILDHESPHEDDIDTPHSSKTEIQLLFLLETHRLTGWW